MADASMPFDDLKSLLNQLPKMDDCGARKSLEALAAKPFETGDGLTGLRHWLAGWQGTKSPSVAEVHICLLASSYAGVADADTKTFIEAASKGRAPVNILCMDRGLGLRVLELATEMPHRTALQSGVWSVTDVWSERDCMAAVAFGMESAAAHGNLLGLSDLASGNKIFAAALLAHLLNITPDELLRHDDQLDRSSLEVLLAGLQGCDDPLEAMRLVAGREIAAIVGGMIAARSRRIPVFFSGIGALAAYAVLWAMNPDFAAHARLASVSGALEAACADGLAIHPVVGVSVDVGPGCGIALAVPIAAGACDLEMVVDQN